MHDDDALVAQLAVRLGMLTEEKARAALAQCTRPLAEHLLATEQIKTEQFFVLEKARDERLRQGGGAPGAPAAAPATAAAAAEPAPSGPVAYRPGISLQQLLRQAAAAGANDLHVHSGARLKVRVHGRLEDASSEPIPAAEAERLILGLVDEETRGALTRSREVDFVYSAPEVGRFRANVYRQQRGLDAVFRPIADPPPTLADLGLPESLARFTRYHQGLILLTGPAGCGKSSTLAALVDLINDTRRDHVITIEDPIEFVHRSKSCTVNQRQVGEHTGSFGRALRAALREDPDVIVIGELRDLETVSLALTAAETGHLVLTTLHTNNAVRTIHRLLGVFPAEQQPQIRMMVSESLIAIVSQRLLRRLDDSGRVPAIEILINNNAVGNLIRDEKTFQIPSLMQTQVTHGMRLLDGSLAELVAAGVVGKEEARGHAEEPARFE